MEVLGGYSQSVPQRCGGPVRCGSAQQGQPADAEAPDGPIRVAGADDRMQRSICRRARAEGSGRKRRRVTRRIRSIPRTNSREWRKQRRPQETCWTIALAEGVVGVREASGPGWHRRSGAGMEGPGRRDTGLGSAERRGRIVERARLGVRAITILRGENHNQGRQGATNDHGTASSGMRRAAGTEQTAGQVLGRELRNPRDRWAIRLAGDQPEGRTRGASRDAQDVRSGPQGDGPCNRRSTKTSERRGLGTEDPHTTLRDILPTGGSRRTNGSMGRK